MPPKGKQHKKKGNTGRRGGGTGSATIAGGGQRYDGDAHYIGRLTNGPLVRPDKMQVRLPYTQNFTLAPSTNITDVHKFALNSLWDPDQTASSGSGQAMGSGQWAAIYSAYRVLGVDVSVQCAQGSTANVPLEVAFAPSTQLVVGGAGEEYFRRVAEAPRSRRLFLPLGGGSMTSARAYYPVYELFGLTQSQYLGEKDYAGVLNGSDPAIIMYLAFAAYNATSRTTDGYFRVQLNYHVELFDPKLTASTV